ncbi:glutathione S-transferase family protein [Pseudooceanicola aestuarii]|uniref:glutathione S-transferase family protein n=1 Tax=Pseudooceanicola aestuarii TaxID=2697319 RepID=UPI0013D3692B|nr:glutathione S-transferase family protein [Pseudooceanicola aestuarii]
MLTLYHAGNSVCSVKVRLALEEANQPWEGVELNLGRGDQHAPDYLKLNRAGVVPTLIDDGRVLVESSVIVDYVAGMSPDLVPADPYRAARARNWGMRGLALHAAANTVSFASYGRLPMLNKTEAEREAVYARMPDPEAAAKRRDLVDNGAASLRVAGALAVLRQMARDIEAELAETGGPWLAGAQYSMADIAVAAYVSRTDCVGLAGLWEDDCPAMTDWWAALQERPAWVRATQPWVTPDMLKMMKDEGLRVFADV